MDYLLIIYGLVTQNLSRIPHVYTHKLRSSPGRGNSEVTSIVSYKMRNRLVENEKGESNCNIRYNLVVKVIDCRQKMRKGDPSCKYLSQTIKVRHILGTVVLLLP